VALNYAKVQSSLAKRIGLGQKGRTDRKVVVNVAIGFSVRPFNEGKACDAVIGRIEAHIHALRPPNWTRQWEQDTIVG
jgi:hypothetical protein